MVVSFRSVSIVNTKLRIAGANFLGEAVSEKLTRQQQNITAPCRYTNKHSGFCSGGI